MFVQPKKIALKQGFIRRRIVIFTIRNFTARDAIEWSKQERALSKDFARECITPAITDRLLSKNINAIRLAIASHIDACVGASGKAATQSGSNTLHQDIAIIALHYGIDPEIVLDKPIVTINLMAKVAKDKVDADCKFQAALHGAKQR